MKNKDKKRGRKKVSARGSIKRKGKINSHRDVHLVRQENFANEELGRFNLADHHSSDQKLLDFRKMLAIIHKNFLVLSRDKARMLPLLMFPIFMILVFGYTAGHTPIHISTALIAYDNSPASLMIQQEISNNQAFAVRHVVSTEGEGKKLLDNGKVRVLILIPPNLQKDLDDGLQTGITIIVDESDSSVASTAKSTLNSIISRVSRDLSLQKLGQFQQSVGNSVSMLQEGLQRQDVYGYVSTYAEAAAFYISQAKKVTDNQAKGIIASAKAPRIFVPSNRHTTLNENNTFLALPPNYFATQAQIASLKSSSAYSSAAASDINAVSILSEEANIVSTQMQEYLSYKKNVLEPVKAIKVFTKYKGNSLISPVVYEEKPAYGTGKRPIDFVIPVIIALTIFQGAVMGMGRAVAGEKREGSLTRVFLTPTSNATIIIGTLLFYIIFEVFRSAFLITVAMLFFSIKIKGSLLAIAFIIIIYAGVSTAIGLILSSMVKTEQQFVGMAMLVSMPTIFLAGAFFPLQAMPKALQMIAKFLPVTYGGEALRGVMIKGFSLSLVWYPLLILFVFLLISVTLVFIVFKRDIE